MKRKKVSVRARAIKHGYRSGLEESVANQLQENSIPFEYEKEKLQYTQPSKSRTYTPDFILPKKDGTNLYIETKGYWPASEREKMKWVRECNPALDIRLLFMNPYTKISKRSKTTYADIANKLGYRWAKASSKLPEEWLEDVLFSIDE